MSELQAFELRWSQGHALVAAHNAEQARDVYLISTGMSEVDLDWDTEPPTVEPADLSRVVGDEDSSDLFTVAELLADSSGPCVIGEAM